MDPEEDPEQSEALVQDEQRPTLENVRDPEEITGLARPLAPDHDNGVADRSKNPEQRQREALALALERFKRRPSKKVTDPGEQPGKFVRPLDPDQDSRANVPPVLTV